MPEPARLSAIVINYNGGHDLVRCLKSVAQQRPDAELVVVDNGSIDGSLDIAEREVPNLVAIRSVQNDGFAGGANRGVAAASGDTLLLLNPDVELQPGCVELLTEALDERTKVCGPLLITGAAERRQLGGTVDLLGFSVEVWNPKPVLYVPGAALATTREWFGRMGGFDARYFLIYEDVDFCWRSLIEGGDVRVVAEAVATHRGGGSIPGGYATTGEGAVRLTSMLRIALRERNALATQLKCAPAVVLPLTVPGMLLQTTATAAWALFAHRPDIARSLLGGVLWNVRQLPATFRARGALRGDRRAALSRLHRGFFALEVLRVIGPPRLVDDPVPAPAATSPGRPRAIRGDAPLVVNGRILTDPVPTGVTRTAQQLVEALIDSDVRLDVLVPRGTRVPRGARVVGPPMQGRLIGQAWEQFVLPQYAGDSSVLSPANIAPVATARSALVIQDLSIQHYPQWSNAWGRAYGRLMEWSARRAALVIVPSQAVADDVAQLIVDSRRIAVVHWAIEPGFAPVDSDRVASVLSSLGITQPYVLCVGWRSPRKNAATLVEAHRRAEHRQPHMLVLVGPGNTGFADVNVTTSHSVRTVDYASDATVRALYSGAVALAYPSLAEGFGLPPHEAAAMRIPAIVSDIPVLRETAPAGSTFTPPLDVDAWADAIVAAVGGRLPVPEQTQRTWRNVASETIAALQAAGLLS